ncbi:MAG: hypothetical protein KC418_06235 [Anaerolineales bacterium]|nr:hypothetical protein [Anaerolineales bacterium]
MKSVQRQTKELEQQRRRLVTQIYQLLDELEDRPRRRKTANLFPFNLVATPITWALLKLEKLVDKMVVAVLNRFDGGRR